MEGGSARFIAEFRPPWQIGEFFQELFALSTEGRLDKRGNPKLTDLAVLMHRYPEDFFYPPLVPPAVQRALARPLARRAQREGAGRPGPGRREGMTDDEVPREKPQTAPDETLGEDSSAAERTGDAAEHAGLKSREMEKAKRDDSQQPGGEG